MRLYIPSKLADIETNASSANTFTRRMGWSLGTLLSGDNRITIDVCFSSRPLTAATLKHPRSTVDPWGAENGEKDGSGSGSGSGSGPEPDLQASAYVLATLFPQPASWRGEARCRRSSPSWR